MDQGSIFTWKSCCGFSEKTLKEYRCDALGGSAPAAWASPRIAMLYHTPISLYEFDYSRKIFEKQVSRSL